MNEKSISDKWERGDLYERYVGRWSRQVAPEFLAWLNCGAGERWLDVGCGTGAVSAAILDGYAPETVTGVEPSGGFLAAAQENLAGRARLLRGNAAEIPLRDSSVDNVVSGLMLNFVPDPHKALIEMRRVTGDGGAIGAYVWDYTGKMEFMRVFWDAVTELDPPADGLDEGLRFPICQPDALQELFAGVGLKEVRVGAIDISTTFTSFEDFWQPFLGGQGPGPAYVTSLEPGARERLRERLRARVQDRIPTGAEGPLIMNARAWQARGTVAK